MAAVDPMDGSYPAEPSVTVARRCSNDSVDAAVLLQPSNEGVWTLEPVVNEPFDPWAAEVRADPHPMYHAMRAEAPVYRAVGPITRRTFFFLTPHDTVLAALRDPRLGREYQKLPDGVREQHQLPGMDAFEMVNRHVLNMDPPDHTRLRRLVSSAFTPKRIRELEPRIAEIAATCMDGAARDGEFDLIDKLAMPLPITVIAELLGVPIEDQDHFRTMVDRILRPADDADGMAAGMEMIQYINGAIEHRKANPGDDLLSALIHLEEEGDRLDHSELLSMVQLLLIAGHETTVNLIGNGMLELLTHRDQFDLLVADPSLLDGAIEEMLRFNGPVETTFPRFAYEDVEIDGVIIPCGDQVIPVLLAANRDPAVFDEPDRFDITRAPNKHIGFGFGIHYCLGAPLARLEAKVAFRALLDRYPNMELAVDRTALEWTPDPFLRGVRQLPIAV